MGTQYLMPMLRNVQTGQTQQVRELSGSRFSTRQQKQCLEMANQYAVKLSQRTGDTWVGFTKTYTPTS